LQHAASRCKIFAQGIGKTDYVDPELISPDLKEAAPYGASEAKVRYLMTRYFKQRVGGDSIRNKQLVANGEQPDLHLPAIKIKITLEPESGLLRAYLQPSKYSA
jgi:hypothetical protein